LDTVAQKSSETASATEQVKDNITSTNNQKPNMIPEKTFTSDEQNSFSSLANEIRTDVIGAINDKNEALQGEASLVAQLTSEEG